MADKQTHQYKHPHPAVAVDLVIFTLREDGLHILLIERGVAPFLGSWALPGGFVQIDEGLLEAAQRELREETGLSQGYLEQVGAFGDPNRDPRERVISIAFFAIISADAVALQAGSDARRVSWQSIDQLPTLAFDHRLIIDGARAKLADKINRTTIALEFLPPEFTLTDLQQVFEAVRGEAVDKRNFRKWVESLSFIKPTGRTRRGGQHRPASLFRSNTKALLPAPNLLPEVAASGTTVDGAAVAAAAYRKGFQEALSAMHRSVVDAEKALLKTVSTR
jgi:8-oxo-dGTP diphosphatase